MKRFKLLAVFCFYSISHLLLAQEDNIVNADPPQVNIPGTQQVTLSSSIVKGQEYVLQINLPRNFNNADKKFPVVFLLDSQWDFPLVSAIYGEQFYDGFLPEIVVVGITWGGMNPNHDALRRRDFTPTAMGEPESSGNAANFLSFIKHELTPFLESNYKVAGNSRTLMGSSLGGLFTLYAMLHEPGFFQHYVLTSPATHWDNEAIFKIEKEFSQKNKALPATLYMAVGELEDVAQFKKLENTLKQRGYSGLKMETKVLENIGHSGTKPEGYTRGLQWSFKKPEIKLTDAQLKPYTGSYKIGNDTLQVIVENNKLVGVMGNRKTAMTAESENEFYVPGTYLFVRFNKDKDNKVSNFWLEQYEGGIYAQKIK